MCSDSRRNVNGGDPIVSPLIASRRLAGWLVAVFLAATMIAAPAWAEPGRIKALFLGDNGHHTPAPRGRADPVPGAGRHRRRLYRRPCRPQLREPRPLRLPDHLRQSRRDRTRPGTGTAGVRRGGQGTGRAPLRVVLLPQLAEVRGAGGRPVQEPHDGRLSRPHRQARPSGDEGREGVRGVGRDVRPHQALRRPRDPDDPRRWRQGRAVDVGPDAGQGAGLLHGLRA